VPEAGQSTPPNPEDLISRYQRRVYAVIYRMTGHHSEVDDLCQETLLQALRGLPRLQHGSNVDSWVYRIAMNVSVDYLRRKSKERKIVERLKTEGERTGSPSDNVDPELMRSVERAVDSLPPDQKAVVVLRMFENKSHEEIAEILETPAATVRWRLFSARQKLEELLSPWLGAEGGAR
jgi:RNA polymerase sigma-70 factor (ECF subfamily)